MQEENVKFSSDLPLDQKTENQLMPGLKTMIPLCNESCSHLMIFTCSVSLCLCYNLFLCLFKKLSFFCLLMRFRRVDLTSLLRGWGICRHQLRACWWLRPELRHGFSHNWRGTTWDWALFYYVVIVHIQNQVIKSGSLSANFLNQFEVPLRHRGTVAWHEAALETGT